MRLHHNTTFTTFVSRSLTNSLLLVYNPLPNERAADLGVLDHL